jgi:hypothetical protein
VNVTTLQHGNIEQRVDNYSQRNFKKIIKKINEVSS